MVMLVAGIAVYAARVPLEAAMQAVSAFAGLSLLVWVGLKLSARTTGRAMTLGPADRVTLLRAVIVALFAGLLSHPGAVAALSWWLPAMALLALLLDGADGWIARQSGTVSRFGARFDMEIDALFILVLSALAFELDKAGAWVLMIGGLRYAFVAAGLLLPALTAELPPSKRRQTVCVVQVAALLITLVPAVGPPLSTALLAGALGLLCYSFAADVIWLLAKGRTAQRSG